MKKSAATSLCITVVHRRVQTALSSASRQQVFTAVMNGIAPVTPAEHTCSVASVQQARTAASSARPSATSAFQKGRLNT